jgi:hypothetical protein
MRTSPPNDWDDKLPWKADQIINIWNMGKDGRLYYSPRTVERMLDSLHDPALTEKEQKVFNNSCLRALFGK